MLNDFLYQALPARVIFGAGRVAALAAELDRLGISRAIVLSSAGKRAMAEKVAADIGPRAVAVFAGAVMHTPVTVTEMALADLKAARADGILAIGGGSTIGLGKALALRTDLPQIAVPTTFSGSELTPLIGETEGGVKRTQRSMAVLETVVYDPALVATLPPAVAGPSGMNAVAHAVEALYAEAANPITSMLAEEGIRVLGRALPRLMTDRGETEAWRDALYGACLGGLCLGSVGMALHHKLCHILGGRFDLPHADIHCLLIPYAARYNAEAAPEAMARVARALDAESGPDALYELMQQSAQMKTLRAFGLSKGDLDRVAEDAAAADFFNPAPVTRSAVRRLLHAAHEGRRP